ncbi:MAG TPA: HAD family phosphatase, partial [Saprospiraceae bacterium]|nr:HAD family phosphatase [Saprospiraceae bacterium]
PDFALRTDDFALHMLKHILFDNDGTIVDSEIIAVRATLSLLEPYGFRMSEQEYSRRFPGLLERDILAIIKEEHGVEVGADYFDRLRALHVEGFERHLCIIPGMEAIFRGVRVPKSMVSNGSVRHVVRCLEHVGLHDALDGRIFSAEHVARPKPHPDVYRHALEELQLHASETMAVEDSPTGVAAAREAGLRVVGFLGAAHIHDGHGERLSEAGATWLAADAQALGLILQGLGAL